MKRLFLLGVVTAVLPAAGGTALAATLACNGGRRVGGNGPDTVYGSDVRDVIFSLKGKDLVRGAKGSGTRNGDGGSDKLVGGRGDDEVNGADGDDVVAGNPGNDRLNGGKGNDRIEANDGFTDIISCGNGRRDLVVFDKGLDRFTGCENRAPRQSGPRKFFAGPTGDGGP